MPIYFFVLMLVIVFLAMAVKILNEYERGVIFRLGRVLGKPKGPGIIILIPVIDRMVKVPLRTVVHDVPPQDVITKDNVSIKVNAVVYFRVIDPMKAIIDVENYLYATSQLSQTTLRSVLGQAELDDLLSTGRRSTSGSRRSSTCTRSRGASRYRTLRSRTSICRRKCSAP